VVDGAIGLGKALKYLGAEGSVWPWRWPCLAWVHRTSDAAQRTLVAVVQLATACASESGYVLPEFVLAQRVRHVSRSAFFIAHFVPTMR